MLFYEQQYLLTIHIIPVHIMTVTFVSICYIAISDFFYFPSLKIGL